MADILSYSIKITIMNHKIKIALTLIAGGTLIYLGRKMKNRSSEPKTFTGEDKNTYQENETYFTSDGKIYKNGKQLHFKTPEMNDETPPKINFKSGFIPENYNIQPRNVEYHHKGVRHH
ncbi:MAG: hypothetical protein DI622_15350 [Chryseobacterium sp.]|nr:MAG: hypothetical protein DI622_15350 [Chryseobacterium sp.]